MAVGVTEVELSRAKKGTVSAVLSNLESRAIVAEDIGRQILTYGSRCVHAAAEFLIPSNPDSENKRLCRTASCAGTLPGLGAAPRSTCSLGHQGYTASQRE